MLHSGSQDLELIYKISGLPPKNVFDTQIAAGFLGLGYQVGYSRLVAKLLGSSIPKTECYTDWSSRPLSESQVEYAIEDVCHLLPLFDKLKEELAQLGRLQWAYEECKRLQSEKLYERNKGRHFLRIKGSSMLSKRGLAVLESLCVWRDKEAQRINKPIRSVLSDTLLLELARKPPTQLAQIERIRGVRKGDLKIYGLALLAAVEAGLSVPDGDCPTWPSRRLPLKEEVILADIMFSVIKLIAYEVDLATELIATRDEIQSFVRVLRDAKPDLAEHPLAHGWRWELAGHKLYRLLSGGTLELKFDGKEIYPVKMKILPNT